MSNSAAGLARDFSRTLIMMASRIVRAGHHTRGARVRGLAFLGRARDDAAPGRSRRALRARVAPPPPPALRVLLPRRHVRARRGDARVRARRAPARGRGLHARPRPPGRERPRRNRPRGPDERGPRGRAQGHAGVRDDRRGRRRRSDAARIVGRRGHARRVPDPPLVRVCGDARRVPQPRRRHRRAPLDRPGGPGPGRGRHVQGHRGQGLRHLVRVRTIVRGGVGGGRRIRRRDAAREGIRREGIGRLAGRARE